MTIDKSLDYYLRLFSHLRTDRTGGWNEATCNQAPHKPFLLLSVLDLFSQGDIRTNFIQITPELGEIFAAYWSKVMPIERRGNFALPFFHLRSSGFWHLAPVPGEEAVVKQARQIDTLTRLRKIILGVQLDDELYELLQSKENRIIFRTAIIQSYFADQFHTLLFEQGQLNIEAFHYGEKLIEKARKAVKEAISDKETYQPLVRDQGFRRVVVRIYDHRCAFCGVRMLTPDGHSAVDASHIVPWRVSHDDDPRNGMALCRLCHWTFDEGLASVSNKYQIVLSRNLLGQENMPGHLTTLQGRSIIGPQDNELWPSLHTLGWHRMNVFQKHE
jgi:putative restriction endonuclease